MPMTWQVMQALLGMPGPRNIFGSLALANGISSPDVAEAFADVFFSPIARPSNNDEVLTPMGGQYPAQKFDEYSV